MAPLVVFLLFIFMVLLVSTGDSGDVVKGRKIGDVIMPDREIETITSEEVAVSYTHLTLPTKA